MQKRKAVNALRHAQRTSADDVSVVFFLRFGGISQELHRRPLTTSL